jgi:predicted transcriptional regulator
MAKHSMPSKSRFFEVYRKRGFSLTLEILDQFETKEAKERDFFEKLRENESYLNEFYRVKQSLIDFGLILYKLDNVYDKVIGLTEKGKEFLKMIKEMDQFLSKKTKQENK